MPSDYRPPGPSASLQRHKAAYAIGFLAPVAAYVTIRALGENAMIEMLYGINPAFSVLGLLFGAAGKVSAKSNLSSIGIVLLLWFLIYYLAFNLGK